MRTIDRLVTITTTAALTLTVGTTALAQDGAGEGSDPYFYGWRRLVRAGLRGAHRVLRNGDAARSVGTSCGSRRLLGEPRAPSASA